MIIALVQAAAQSIMESLCCDNFFAAVKSLDEASRPRLLKLFAAFMLVAKSETRDLAELFPQCIAAVYDRFFRMLAALLALLSPMPDYMGATASDINEIRKYRGQCLEECTLRDILVMPGDKASPNMWVKLFDELIAKGQEGVKMLPRIMECEKLLSAMDLETPLKIDVEILADVARRLPKMAANTRAGLCDKVMGLLKQVTVAYCTSLLATKPGAVQLTSSNLDAVIAGLECFGHVPGAAKKFLVISELLAICRGFPEDLQSPAMPEEASDASVASFMEAWGGVPKEELSQMQEADVRDHLHAISWIFRLMAGKVKAGVLLAASLA